MKKLGNGRHIKERMASIRQCGMREQTTKRQAQHQQHMGSIRASETPEQALNRRQSNKQSMSIKRKRNVSVECAVSAFHSEVKLGPDYVCTCIATHQIAEWGTCANQLTPRVMHLGALVVLCVCVCVCPRPSSATRATKRQTRHTGGLSIVFASV